MVRYDGIHAKDLPIVKNLIPPEISQDDLDKLSLNDPRNKKEYKKRLRYLKRKQKERIKKAKEKKKLK